jgi:hypothetical protein
LPVHTPERRFSRPLDITALPRRKEEKLSSVQNFSDSSGKPQVPGLEMLGLFLWVKGERFRRAGRTGETVMRKSRILHIAAALLVIMLLTMVEPPPVSSDSNSTSNLGIPPADAMSAKGQRERQNLEVEAMSPIPVVKNPPISDGTEQDGYRYGSKDERMEKDGGRMRGLEVERFPQPLP